MKTLVGTAIVVGLSAMGLSACEKTVKAPFDQGVCFAVELGEEGSDPVFN